MDSVFVTGANRGIGFEIVKEFSGKAKVVFAGCRNLDSATELQNLATENLKIKLIKIDVCDEASIRHAYEEIASHVDHLTCLVNNAGVITGYHQGVDDLPSMDESTQLFRTNAVAPVTVAKIFLPLLRKASQTSSIEGMHINKASILNISSSMGSTELTKNEENPGMYDYRMSKCALNMATQLLAMELEPENILVASLAPGWTRTDMGGSHAPQSALEAVQRLAKAIGALDGRNHGRLTYKEQVAPN